MEINAIQKDLHEIYGRIIGLRNNVSYDTPLKEVMLKEIARWCEDEMDKQEESLKNEIKEEHAE